MSSFNDLKLSEPVMKAIASMGGCSGRYQLITVWGLNMIQVHEFVDRLAHRRASQEVAEKRIASGFIRKSDMNNSVNWGVTCNVCPLTDVTNWGQCLAGFTCDTVPYETLRCRHLVNLGNKPLSKDDFKMVIVCKGG